MSSRFSRRQLLAGFSALGASTLVPRFSYGQAPTAPPKRLLVVFTPNGSIAEAWRPTGTETNFTLGEIHQPLTALKDKLVVIDGVRAQSCENGPGDDHMRGMAGMLTGTELLPGDTQGGAGTPSGLAGGISIDQLIANAIGTTTRFKSLEFGVYVNDSSIWGRMIYSGPGQALPPMEDPMAAYNRIFAGLNVDTTALQRLIKRRQSVLDQATGSLGKLSQRVSASDRVRIEAHTQSIRQIEKQLLVQAVSCVPPTVTNINRNQSANFRPVGRLMMDMIAASFGCDQTRVASLQFTRSTSDMTFPDVGVTDGHHTLSHDGDDVQATITKLIAVNKWYAGEFAYLLNALEQIKEADGTSVLDNTIVYFTNELSRGNVHGHNPLPQLLAGKAGGALQTGRYLKLAQARPHNNVMVSIAQKLGVNITTFGNPAYCTGPLTGL